MPVARIEDFAIDIGRDPLVGIVVGVVGYPDMLAAVDVAELVRDRRAHDRASRRAVVNETAANTIFAMATATVDALAAGLSQERSAPRDCCHRHHAEDDVTELEERAEDAPERQPGEQTVPSRVAFAAGDPLRKGRGTRHCEVENARVKIWKRQHSLGEANRPQHLDVTGTRDRSP